MWSLIFKVAVSYIESHPEVLVSLFDELAKAGINALKAHNAAASAK